MYAVAQIQQASAIRAMVTGRIFDALLCMIYGCEDIGKKIMPWQMGDTASVIYQMNVQSENWNARKRLILQRN